MASRSVSRIAMQEKFSGNTATQAPASAATRSKRSAVARLLATSGPLVICKAATVGVSRIVGKGFEGEVMSDEVMSGEDDIVTIHFVQRFGLQPDGSTDVAFEFREYR